MANVFLSTISSSALTGPSGYSGYSGVSGFSGFSGISGFSGWSGISGFSGYSGKDGNFGGATFDYTFDTDTANTDPGTGKLKFNNANVQLASAMYIDDESDGAIDIQPFLRTIDDSSSTIKGHYRISNKFDSTDFALFTISSLTEHTGYFEVTSSYVSGPTTAFSNTEDVIITFARTGDKGDTGISGFSGWSGISGFSGFSGQDGTIGSNGASGFSGWSGVSGFSGWSGVGTSGFSGWSGISGFSGWSGISGFSGWSGVGTSGFSGWSGRSGFSGWSGAGTSGFSGWSGESGYSGAGASINVTDEYVPYYIASNTSFGTSSIKYDTTANKIILGGYNFATPAYDLVISNGGTNKTPISWFTSYNDTSAMWQYRQSGTVYDKWRISYDYSTYGFYFYDEINTSERMRISNTGYVGIGTSSPSSILEISGAMGSTISDLGTLTANANIDTASSNIFKLVLGANNLILTFTNPPSNTVTRPVTVVVKQDGTGSRFVTFANSKYTDATTPVLSTGANAVDVLTFFTIDGGTEWYGSFAMANVG